MTFGPTDMYVNFTIYINDDNNLEATEKFNLTILIPNTAKAMGIEKSAPAFAIGRILNDESKE